MPGQLHDDRPVYTCFSGVAYKGVPKVIEPEVLNLRLFQRVRESDFDAFHRLSAIREDMAVGDLSHFAQPFQNAFQRPVEIDIPRLAGFGVFGRQVEIPLLQVHPVLREAKNLPGSFLSDRRAPDYRNSIKESISAVESLVKATCGSEKGTLGELIKEIGRRHPVHPALEAAYGRLYGYTSDAKGITSTPTKSDPFMLR